MTLFIAFATLLVLLAIVVLSASVWRGSADTEDAPGLVEKNIAIARERLAALDELHTGDERNSTEYTEERARIEAMLASELGADKHIKRSRVADVGLICVLVLAIPASAAWLYSRIGTPAALLPRPPATADAEQGGPDLPELVAGLEQKLQENPDDVTGWRMLGRTSLAMNDFDKATAAFERAVELDATDVNTLASLAQTRAMAAGGNLAGEATPLLEQAYALDNTHTQTLWLLGIARQQAGRHAEALELLGRLRVVAEEQGDSQSLAAIDEYSLRSQDALAISNEANNAEAANVPSTPTPADEPTTGAGASVTVSVTLGQAAADALAPDTPVFVFARAANGPPLPLAVQRLTVADLPTTLTLDESMAMVPNMTLAAFPEVVVGARASLSGQPVASPGDWSVEAPATIGDNATEASPLTLEIAEQLP